MGIYIKGMEMPTEQYGKMVITLYPNGHVAEYVGDIGRVWEAVPVPPHGRLCDLDALKEMIEVLIEKHLHGYTKSTWDFVCELRSIISDAPTIIPAEEGQE